MPEKSPETYGWLTYMWVVGLACLGGLAAFLRRVREGHARAWNITELAGEILISALAGLITFYLCEWSAFSPLFTAALVGISGHMGSRAIFALEKSVFSAKFPSQPKDGAQS